MGGGPKGGKGGDKGSKGAKKGTKGDQSKGKGKKGDDSSKGKGSPKGKDAGKGKKGEGDGKGKTASSSGPGDLAAALGVDQYEEPDKSCPKCGSDYPTDHEVNFCRICGEKRKELDCFVCEARYLKGCAFCGVCGTPRRGVFHLEDHRVHHNHEQRHQRADSSDRVHHNHERRHQRADSSDRVHHNHERRHQRAESSDSVGDAIDLHDKVEGIDWIYEDDLVKELLGPEPDMLEPMIPPYPEMEVGELCSSVNKSMNVHYSDIVGELRFRVKDYRSRCNWATAELTRWNSDRDSLLEQCADWQIRAEEEQRAADRRNRNVNGLRHMQSGVGRQRTKRVSVVVGDRRNDRRKSQYVQSADVDTNAWENAVELDTNAAGPTQSWFTSYILKMAELLMPMQADVRAISARYGSSCSILFRLYQFLMLFSLLSAACYAPLLIVHLGQVLPTFGNGLSLYGPLPANFFFAAFHSQTQPATESWRSVVEITRSAAGGLTVTTHMNSTEFDSRFASCSMVRYVRDCMPIALFAGIFDNSTGVSPYDVFTKRWRSMPGTPNEDWVIYSQFYMMVQGWASWPTCDVNGTGAGIGFPGTCSQYGSTTDSQYLGFSVATDVFPPAGVPDDQRLLHGSRLEIFDAATCLVKTKDDVRDLTGSKRMPLYTSGKDPWLAFMYLAAGVISTTLAIVITVCWWQATEAKHTMMKTMEQIAPMKWCPLVLGLADLSLAKEADRRAWQEALANRLRQLDEDEVNEQKKDDRTARQRQVLYLRRALTILANLSFVAGGGIFMLFVIVNQSELESALSSVLGASAGHGLAIFAPATATALVGAVLPPLAKVLTRLESWPRAWRERLIIYRLFFCKLTFATIFLTCVLELVDARPWFRVNKLIFSPRTSPCGIFLSKEDQAGSEILIFAAMELVFWFLKPFASIVFDCTVHYVPLACLHDQFRSSKLPTFRVANQAVDVLYLFFIMRCSVAFVPYMAFAGPIFLWIALKYSKFYLKTLSRRPFLSDPLGVLVTMQHLFCFTVLGQWMLTIMQLIYWLPYEATCGPLDGFQSGWMTLQQLDIPLKELGDYAQDLLRSNATLTSLIMVVVLALLVIANFAVRGAQSSLVSLAAASSSQQENILTREIRKMEGATHLLVRRHDWLHDAMQQAAEKGF